MEHVLHLELEQTWYALEQVRALDAPFVAFAGRSNVGKSSLLNALAGRRNLARTSSQPGKTRSINLFFVPECAGYCIDLPGYGYARRSKTERRQWASLVDRTFALNRNRGAVVVLIDSRIPPQQLDLELISYLERSLIPFQVVLTKADKCTSKQRSAALRQWSVLARGYRPPLLFSAKTGMNRTQLLETVFTLLACFALPPQETPSIPAGEDEEQDQIVSPSAKPGGDDPALGGRGT